MSDLGPFAIRRIEPGASPASPFAPAPTADTAAASVLKRAADVAADRITGEVERASPADAQIGETLRAQSAAIDAETLMPLLGSLSVPPSLAMPARAPDALAPAASLPHDSQGPSIDPSADAMRTSVFHPLADLPATRESGAGGDAAARTPGQATVAAKERLQSLLDRFLMTTTDRKGT